MRKSRPLIAIVFLGMLGAAACAEATPTAQEFVTKASEAGAFEIQSSQLALQKSGNDGVKQYAQQMIDDHTKANDQLKAALESSQSKAQPTDTLNSKHAKIMNKLNALSGADFDKKYISVQTDAHKEAVKLFKSYSKDGDDASLKSFAAQTLPVLQGHLDHIKQLKSSM